MKTISIAIPLSTRCEDFDRSRWAGLIGSLAVNGNIARILIACTEQDQAEIRTVTDLAAKVTLIRVDSWISARVMNRLLEESRGDGLLLSLRGANLELDPNALAGLMHLAGISGAGLLYSDYRQVANCSVRDILTLDYQPGSIRESFDFGPIVLIAKAAAQGSLRRHGRIADGVRWCGFYDLRLKLSIDRPLVHCAEPGYREHVIFRTPYNTTPFYEPDRESREYQMEAERVAADHLRRIGAHVESGSRPPFSGHQDYPVTASIVIPTRNRERTIAESIRSALSQATSFDYNILIVDDHSSDRTGEIIQKFCTEHRNIVHLIPESRHLGIGGLWNTAIHSPHGGRYAVQLDSDDVYSHSGSLEALIGAFRANGNMLNAPRYAMVVGSYQTVNAALEEIPQGLHRRLEVSCENGRNNLLCVDGPGAPRAFYVPVLRQFGFPDISFGEDYAVALRIARDYDIGRVYDCLYLARQWDGNTGHTLPLGSVKALDLKEIVPPGMDAAGVWNRMGPIVTPLVMATVNRNNSYKDYVRSVEIQARRRKNLGGLASEGRNSD